MFQCWSKLDAVTATVSQSAALRCDDHKARRRHPIPLRAELDFEPLRGNHVPQVILPNYVRIILSALRALCTLCPNFRNCTIHCAMSEGCM